MNKLTFISLFAYVLLFFILFASGIMKNPDITPIYKVMPFIFVQILRKL
ncbi:hypothetical protein [Alkaliphilus pronyensis]|nr:hypothetical protein [Alkaliphilus pronyensis]